MNWKVGFDPVIGNQIREVEDGLLSNVVGNGFVESSVQRVVLIEKTHDITSVVGHVFTNHEGQVSTLNVLVVENRTSNLVLGPVGISGICDGVIVGDEHSDRDIFNVLKWD